MKKKTAKTIIIMAAGIGILGILSSSDASAASYSSTARPTYTLSAGALAGYSANIGLNAEIKTPKKSDPTATISAGALTVAIIDTNPTDYTTDASVDSIVTATEEQTTTYGYSNLGLSTVDKLNVRAAADKSSEAVGQMNDGAACEIIAYEGDWVQIESGNVSGYVMSSYLTTGDEAKEKANELATEVATVQADSLRVRSEASADASVLKKVNSGTQLPVVTEDASEENTTEEGTLTSVSYVADASTYAEEIDEDIDETPEWVEVSIGEDKVGYVSSEYVDVSIELPTAKTMTEVQYGDGVTDAGSGIVAFATQFVGNRYRWGGTSLTNGADCSGFVLSVYAQYSIYLPHSSAGQARYGTTVSASEAQPGDLFFYSRGGRGIGHVAIYIGNGQIVHAANSRDGIKISSAFYQTPITVKRLLN